MSEKNAPLGEKFEIINLQPQSKLFGNKDSVICCSKCSYFSSRYSVNTHSNVE